MSSIGNLVGDLGAALGDEGHNSVVSLTKNPQLQARLDANLSQYDKTRDASSKALDQYIADFLAGNKTASTRATQEQGVIDRYYNGDVERQLADLRTRRAAASDQALARALGYATAAQNRDQIIRSGTGSSYDRQLALKTGADLNLTNLLDNLNQERSDWNFLQGNQLGLIGKRTGIADALAARDLVPSGAMQANLGWNMDTLNRLLGLDQSNKFYGVKYNPSGSEMAGNVIGDVGNIAADISTGPDRHQPVFEPVQRAQPSRNRVPSLRSGLGAVRAVPPLKSTRDHRANLPLLGERLTVQNLQMAVAQCDQLAVTIGQIRGATVFQCRHTTRWILRIYPAINLDCADLAT